MPTPKLFASYLRVSTVKQGRSGLGLEAQKELVNAHICHESGELLAEYLGRKRQKKGLRIAHSPPKLWSIAT